jgi:hypothetical protein
VDFPSPAIAEVTPRTVTGRCGRNEAPFGPSMVSWILAQDRRNASAKTDILSFRITSAGDLRPRRGTRGVAPTLSEPVCCLTCVLVRNVRSRSSSESESEPPRVGPMKPPAKASIGALGDVEAADGLARETRVQFEVLDARFVASACLVRTPSSLARSETDLAAEPVTLTPDAAVTSSTRLSPRALLLSKLKASFGRPQTTLLRRSRLSCMVEPPPRKGVDDA